MSRRLIVVTLILLSRTSLQQPIDILTLFDKADGVEPVASKSLEIGVQKFDRLQTKYLWPTTFYHVKAHPLTCPLCQLAETLNDVIQSNHLTDSPNSPSQYCSSDCQNRCQERKVSNSSHFQLTISLITNHVYSYLKTQRSRSDAEIAIKSANIFVDSLGCYRAPSVLSQTHLTSIMPISVGSTYTPSNFVHFIDPRSAAGASASFLGDLFNGSIPLHWELVPGELIIFPSYVRHYLLANQDPQPRVYLKFDVEITQRTLESKSDTNADGDRQSHETNWKTPVMQLGAPAMQTHNDDLRDYLLQLERLQPSVQKSNKGGWQSRADLFEQNLEVLTSLKTHTYAAIRTYVEEILKTREWMCVYIDVDLSWASINRLWHSNAPHIHPGSIVSGVYYVDSGGTDETSVCHMDPRFIADLDNTTEPYCSKPLPATFVLFPGWLEHYVQPHSTNSPRISISFNSNVRLSNDCDGNCQRKPCFLRKSTTP